MSAAPMGRLGWSKDGELRRTLRATTRAEEATCKALKRAAERDKADLPTLQRVLDYCLKLGIESYLAGHDAEADASPVKEER
jgi:hypothetical protein